MYIRRAKGDDLGKVVNVAIRRFRDQGQAPPADIVLKLSALFNDTDSRIFIASEGSDTFGYLVASEMGGSYRIEDIYVFPEARNEGTSTLLMSALQDLKKPAYVELRSEDLDMKSFFEHFGFKHDAQMSGRIFLHYAPTFWNKVK